jgi:hypothetical protein
LVLYQVISVLLCLVIFLAIVVHLEGYFLVLVHLYFNLILMCHQHHLNYLKRIILMTKEMAKMILPNNNQNKLTQTKSKIHMFTKILIQRLFQYFIYYLEKSN